MTTPLERVRPRLGAKLVPGPSGELRGRVSREEIPVIAGTLGGAGLEAQLVTAIDTRDDGDDAFTLLYRFAPPTGSPALTLTVPIPARDPRFPSLATRSFAASRFEREVHDLFGLVPEGHPDLRRLPLHQFWPGGYHPLRRDTAALTNFVDDGAPFPFQRVEGEGLFEITVGPVHAGIIEPGHFRFTVEGETIVNLETRLGFVHKGTEKLFETLPFERTVALAERISGDESFAHALAYCHALEALAGCTVPPRAALLRVLGLELERLYNHVGDVGMIVNDTGFAFGHAHCFRLREELLRINERLCGHRLLRGMLAPGGLAAPIATGTVRDAATVVGRLAAEFQDVADLCLENTLVLERLLGTGRLTAATARGMQVVGLVARASGIDADLRRDAPADGYRELGVRVATGDAGDVWARTMVRIAEVAESARLVAAVAAGLEEGPSAVELPPLPAREVAFGACEAWRGPITHAVVTDAASRVRRVKVVDPSFRNWPALEYAVLKNIVPDFPLCNKSFNLSYSGNDL